MPKAGCASVASIGCADDAEPARSIEHGRLNLRLRTSALFDLTSMLRLSGVRRHVTRCCGYAQRRAFSRSGGPAKEVNKNELLCLTVSTIDDECEKWPLTRRGRMSRGATREPW